MELYSIRIMTDRKSYDKDIIYCSSLWVSYYILDMIYKDSVEGDCILLYNPLGEIIEYKINDYKSNEDRRKHREKVMSWA